MIHIQTELAAILDFRKWYNQLPAEADGIKKLAYFISREELEMLLSQDEKQLDGIRVYFGATIVEGT